MREGVQEWGRDPGRNFRHLFVFYRLSSRPHAQGHMSYLDMIWAHVLSWPVPQHWHGAWLFVKDVAMYVLSHSGAFAQAFIPAGNSYISSFLFLTPSCSSGPSVSVWCPLLG